MTPSRDLLGYRIQSTTRTKGVEPQAGVVVGRRLMEFDPQTGESYIEAPKVTYTAISFFGPKLDVFRLTDDEIDEPVPPDAEHLADVIGRLAKKVADERRNAIRRKLDPRHAELIGWANALVGVLGQRGLLRKPPRSTGSVDDRRPTAPPNVSALCD